ncbi:hypothetical protein [Desulfovirgula thermocuniculi]|uniref:hypothetical protein n=1 Tax=Desulfovirgula thermocuniculi TaxID=348842 RepID=UPI0012EB27EB|nr:hypothetical protein [Desulfovirgula thermocuniculi]
MKVLDGKGRPVSVPRDRTLRKKLHDYAVSVVRRLGIKKNLGDYPLPTWVEKRYRDYLRDLIAQEREKLLRRQEGQLTTSELTEMASMYRLALNDKQRLQILHTAYSRGGAPAVEALAYALGTDAMYLTLVTRVYLKNIKRLKRGQQLLFFLPPPAPDLPREQQRELHEFALRMTAELRSPARQRNARNAATAAAPAIATSASTSAPALVGINEDVDVAAEVRELFEEDQSRYLVNGDGKRGGRKRAEMLIAGHLRAGEKINTTFAS